MKTQAQIEQAPPSQAERAPELKLSAWRFAGLLSLLMAICFPQVLLGLESFAYGDAGTFAYPVAYHFRESVWHGELPLWNPLSSCGIPFLAQWNTLTLYPLSLFYLLLPMPWSFGLFCLGHLVVGGMGMYFLARRWTGSTLPAAFAGAVFAFNGLTWSGLMWPHIIAAMAWMPWLVLAVERAWSEGARAVLLGGFVCAMQLLSAGAEVILQTWLALGGLCILRIWTQPGARIAVVLRLLAIAGLGAALSAAQLLPFLDLLFHSQRSSAYAAGEMGSIAAMPLTGWLNYVVPLFGCLRNSAGVFVQAGQSWTSSYYLGIGTVVLALTAVLRIRERRAWVLTGLALFGLLMALGSKGLVFDVVKHIAPFVGFLRFPVKFVVLPTFAVPLLAALGLHRVLASTGAEWNLQWRGLKLTAMVLAIAMAFIAGVVWPPSKLGIEPLTTTISAVTRLGFLVAVLFCIWLLQRRSGQGFGRLAPVLLILLAWFDVFTHSSNLSPTVPASMLTPGAVRSAFDWQEKLTAGQSRAMLGKTALWTMAAGAGTNAESAWSATRLSLFMNANLLDGVPKFDGFYSLDLKEYLEMFKRVYFTQNEAAPLRDFLGISYVTSGTNILQWIERESFMPMVTSGQRPVFATETEALNGLLSPEFKPRETVYLPREAQGYVQAQCAPNAPILSSRFSAHRIEAELQAEADTMVVVAQSFYHPWRAFVDGNATRLWRANYGFQAVVVPAGRHRVELVYRDKAFWWGLLFSGATLVLAAGWWVWLKQKDVTPE